MIKKLTKKKALMIILLTVFLLTLSTIGAVNATSYTKDVKDTTLTKKEVKTVNNVKTDLKINKETKKVNTKKINTTKARNKNTNTTSVTKNNNHKNVKTAEPEIVTDYAGLSSLLTSTTNEELTVNLDGAETYESEGIITVNKNIRTLTINGNSRTIDGKTTNGFLDISMSSISNAKINLVIKNLTVKNCKNSYGGAILFNNLKSTTSNITIINSTFSDNCANATAGIIRGGAIYQKTGNMTLIDSNFSNNKVARYSATYGSYLWHIGWGGAVAQETHSILTIDNCNFTSNMAGGRGGAVCQYTEASTVDFQLYINNSKFTENKVISNMSNHENQGGAIFQYGGIIKINDTIFNENSAGLYGGAIYQNNFKSVSSLELNRCNFTKNNILIQGGAVYAKSDINITNSNFTENYAVNIADTNKDNPAVYGGAVYQSVSNAVLNINNSSFTSNYVKNNCQNYVGAGAIYQDTNGVISINDSNFTSNSAVNNHASGNKNGYGAAIYQGTGKLLVNNSHFNLNLIQSLRSNYCYGGAIYAQSISLNYSNLTSNKVDSGGYARGGALWVDNIECNYCNFTNNTAKDGGVIYLDDQSKIMSNIANNTFKDNWVSDNTKFVLSWSMPYYVKIINNTFINNTNNERDMLFDMGAVPNEVHDNVYIDNFLSDSMDYVGVEEITQDFEKEINFYLKPYLGSYNTYNDTVRNGTVTLYINDQVIGDPFPVDNGKTTIKVKLSDLPEKENLITLKYVSESKHYQNMTKTFTLTKNLIDTNITVSANESVKVGKIVTINGTLKRDDEDKTPVAGATVELYINDTKINTTTTDSNGKYVFNYPTTVEGVQYVTVKYIGEGGLESSSNNTQFTVLPLGTSSITVTATSTKFGRDTVISGKLLDEDNNKGISGVKVSILVNNKEEYEVTTSSDGTYSKAIPTKIVGTNNVTVTFVGNEDYKKSTNKTTFQVEKMGTKLLLDKIGDSKVGNDVTVKGKLVDDDGNAIGGETVTININGQEYEITTSSDGSFSKAAVLDTSGKNNITVTYPENNNYLSCFNKTSFNVEKAGTQLTVETSDDVKIGESVTVKGKLVDEKGNGISGESVTVQVNGKEYKVTTGSDGSYSKTVTADTSGKNNVTVTYNGSENYLSTSNKTTFNVEKSATKLTVNKINDTSIGSKAKVTGKLLDETGKAVSNATIKVTVDGKTYTTKTNNDGSFAVDAVTNTSGKLKVKVNYSGSDNYTSSSTTSTVTVKKLDVIVKVKSVTGVIGENMTFTATVTDKKGKKVNGGNLIFKLNGISYNTNKRFDNSSTTPYKFTVKDGKVTLTLTAEYYLKNGGNITATYSGSSTYNDVYSKIAKLTVKLRTMKISVKANPSRVKQYKKVTFTATVTDVTNNAKNKTALLENSYVLFKINGKTIKVKGKTANVTVKSNKVTYKYTIPAGTAGIYVNKKMRFYNVTAKYGSKLFYMKNNSNNTKYNVVRSKITIKVNNAIIKNNKLSIKGSIKDYMKKYVKGTNKVCIKIDGLTYKVNGNVQYFKIKNGRINLKNIKIKNPSSVKKLVIVSGERVAYLKGQSKAKKIIKL